MNILVPNWKEILLKAYSVWGNWALIALVLAPEALYFFFRIDTNPVVWGRLLIITAIFNIIGRIIDQPREHAWKRRGIILGAVVFLSMLSVPALAQDRPYYDGSDRFDDVAFELISRWEGEKKVGDLHVSYQDIVGVWTICYGHTATAGPGQYKTDRECRCMLVEEIREYQHGLHAYFDPITVKHRLTPERDTAYVSLAYNVGVRRAGRSTATRRLNRGDIWGGCTALGWWNKAGGRVVRGLVNRRQDEIRLCRMGLST